MALDISEEKMKEYVALGWYFAKMYNIPVKEREDIVQAYIVRILERYEQYDETLGYKPSSWLSTVFKNLAHRISLKEQKSQPNYHGFSTVELDKNIGNEDGRELGEVIADASTDFTDEVEHILGHTNDEQILKVLNRPIFQTYQNMMSLDTLHYSVGRQTYGRAWYNKKKCIDYVLLYELDKHGVDLENFKDSDLYNNFLNYKKNRNDFIEHNKQALELTDQAIEDMKFENKETFSLDVFRQALTGEYHFHLMEELGVEKSTFEVILTDAKNTLDPSFQEKNIKYNYCFYNKKLAKSTYGQTRHSNNSSKYMSKYKSTVSQLESPER